MSLPMVQYAGDKSTSLSFNNPTVISILQNDITVDEPKPTTTRQPNINGIRRIMKRAHTPEGLVLHYEARLRAFLSDDDGDWHVVEQDDVFTPLGTETYLDDDIVVLGNALEKLKAKRPQCSSPEIQAGIKNDLVAQWSVKDSFTRLVVHTMCRYYGLVSFSDTTEAGVDVLHICHPRFFNSDDKVVLPDVSFHQLVFNK
ncbi:hypothetical protein GGI25_001924 [Coemansia spiralis]|uniref:Uncharacterized protein n=2 Tax=Coemansia TaxID=4863 RepID=A0A9W8G519_9FUNG|nr:hypothetical protein EDC05_002220 [Coemansia umbellata]KAJ2678935.1 hypothetical protein GGI25_001924 [Coemansia spiralis]